MKSRPSMSPPFSNQLSRHSHECVAVDSADRVGKFHHYRGYFLLLIAGIALWLCFSFIKPVVVGIIFAAVLYPLMVKMAHWRIGASWKALIIVIGFTIAFLIPVGVLVFLGVDALIDKVQSIQASIADAGTPYSISGFMEFFGIGNFVEGIMKRLSISDAQLHQFVVRALQTGATFLTGVLQKLVADIPGMLISSIVILFTIFYLLIDGRRAVRFIEANSFFSRSDTDHLIKTIQSLCYSVIVASIVAALVQAVLISLACLMTKTDGIALIALFTFIASFIPVVGTAPVTLFLIAQAFISGDVFSGVVFVVFTLLIGVSDNFVRPMVLRGGANLHPLVGFVAAFGALETIGFYGLFIGPVVAGLFFYVLPLVTKSFPRPSSSR